MQVSLCNGVLKDIPRQLAEHMKKEIKEWVEEELCVFDNKTIGGGFHLVQETRGEFLYQIAVSLFKIVGDCVKFM